MGIIVCFGLGSALGLFFGPVHSVMPFLLLGIGIDNMFVIVQCYENIKSRKGLDFSQKFGVAMQVRPYLKISLVNNFSSKGKLGSESNFVSSVSAGVLPLSTELI